MQYLLTEEEMSQIRTERAQAAKLPGGDGLRAHMEMLGRTCPTIATTMTPDWRDKPYGCIHVNRRESYGYCDRCPVLDICPLDKDFSK